MADGNFPFGGDTPELGGAHIDSHVLLPARSIVACVGQPARRAEWLSSTTHGTLEDCRPIGSSSLYHGVRITRDANPQGMQAHAGVGGRLEAEQIIIVDLAGDAL